MIPDRCKNEFTYIDSDNHSERILRRFFLNISKTTHLRSKVRTGLCSTHQARSPDTQYVLCIKSENEEKIFFH